jgi:hypothetical protein
LKVFGILKTFFQKGFKWVQGKALQVAEGISIQKVYNPKGAFTLTSPLIYDKIFLEMS